ILHGLRRHVREHQLGSVELRRLRRRLSGNVVCVGGECGCPGGLTPCGDTCVNLRTDREHCGACGTSCAGTGQPCYDGACSCPTVAQQWAGFSALTALRPGCVPWEV